MKDLIVLTADKNAEFAISGLLARTGELGARAITWDIKVHPHHDPGCLNESHDFLRPFHLTHAHALVLFDHSGCGHESKPPIELEREVEQRLAANGWGRRAAVVILVPELEVWVWSNSPHVARCMGWDNANGPLRVWLEGKGLWQRGESKPRDPKAALEVVLRNVGQPRSSSLYKDLADHVSLDGHHEPAFVSFRRIVQGWFPQ
jgi:hypothetical protein